MTTCNALIESVCIDIEPDGTASVNVLLVNQSEFPPHLTQYKRTFCISGNDAPRSVAERLGAKVFALAWLLDWHGNVFEAKRQIVRVRWAPTSATHPEPYILAIGHAIHDRWLENKEMSLQFPYPFYTGVPDVTVPNEPSGSVAL